MKRIAHRSLVAVLLPIVLLLASANPAQSAYTLIAHGFTGGTSSALDTSTADLIVLAVSFDSGITVSDSKSNTWTPMTQEAAYAAQPLRFYYCQGGTVGSGHTFTISGGGGAVMAIQAWKGSASSPVDQQNGFGSSNSSVWQTGSITPGQDNELIISAGSFGSSSPASFSIDSGFTFTDQNPLGTYYYVGMAYLVQTSAGAVNPTWSTFNNGFGNINIASFKAAATAATRHSLGLLGAGK